jgi:hypothetical protein
MLHASCFINMFHASMLHAHVSCFMFHASMLMLDVFMLHASCFMLHASCFMLHAHAHASCFMLHVSCFMLDVMPFMLDASCFMLDACLCSDALMCFIQIRCSGLCRPRLQPVFPRLRQLHASTCVLCSVLPLVSRLCALCSVSCFFAPCLCAPGACAPGSVSSCLCPRSQVPGSVLQSVLLSPLSVSALRLCVPGSRVVPLFQVPAQLCHDSRHASPGFMPLFLLCQQLHNPVPYYYVTCHIAMPHATCHIATLPLLHAALPSLTCYIHAHFATSLRLHAVTYATCYMLHAYMPHIATCATVQATLPLRYMHMLATLHKHSYMLHADMLHANMLHVVIYVT